MRADADLTAITERLHRIAVTAKHNAKDATEALAVVEQIIGASRTQQRVDAAIAQARAARGETGDTTG
jgi:hypothetical protein